LPLLFAGKRHDSKGLQIRDEILLRPEQRPDTAKRAPLWVEASAGNRSGIAEPGSPFLVFVTASLRAPRS
jgi:hypothetical protein